MNESKSRSRAQLGRAQMLGVYREEGKKGGINSLLFNGKWKLINNYQLILIFNIF